MVEINDLSPGTAANNTVTGWQENMAPSSVNNTGREDLRVLAAWYQQSQLLAVTETGVNSLSVSLARASLTYTASPSAQTAYLNGLSLRVEIPSTITGVAVLGINGKLKHPIIKAQGQTLSSSMLVAGQFIDVAFDASAKAWRLLGGDPMQESVGIGTNAPEAKVHVEGPNDCNLFVRCGADDAQAVISAQAQDYASSFESVNISMFGDSATGDRISGIAKADLGELYFTGCTNALIFTNNQTPLIFATNSTEKVRITSAGNVLIGDTANALMTQGLTINQGANDDEILALKSSDVAHGLIQSTETDTYFKIRKQSATLGGVIALAYAEDGATSQVLNFNSVGGTADTTKTTAGVGLVNFTAYEHDGANTITNITADGNVFSIRAYVGGAYVTRMLVDEDGDLYSVTAAQTFDEHDDVALIDAYDTVRSIDPIKGEWTDFARENEQKLIDLGILGGRIEDGGMTNVTQLTRLLTGAARQQARNQTDLEAALCELVPGLKNKLTKVRSLPNG